MTFWLLALGGLYALILVFITLRSWRRTRDAQDYILAGSNIGVALGFLTFSATLFSTFTLLGMPDFFRTHGVGAWIFLAVSDGAMAFLIVWFGFRLRRRAAQRGFRGVAGLLADVYGSRWAGVIYFGAIFIFLTPYVAIQIRGIGIFMSGTFPGLLPLWAWASLVVIALVIYSEIGGLRAIIYSDAMQGLLLLLVTWIIAFACIDSMGGVRAMFDEVRVVNEALLSVPGPQNLFTLQFLIASFLAIMLLPVTQPQLTTRIVIMRDMNGMKMMAVALAIFAMLVILPTAAIGMYGAVNHANVPAAEFLAQTLVLERATVLGAAVAIGLMAAAMSTADSQIFALGSELRSLLTGSESSMLLRTKAAILIFALSALLFSIVSSDQLVLLARVSFAGTSLLAPVIGAGILLQRPPPLAIVGPATCSALLLFILSLVGVVPGEPWGVRMDLLLLVGMTAIAGLSCLTRRPGDPEALRAHSSTTVASE